MRELKFRAWNGNKIIPHEEIYIYDGHPCYKDEYDHIGVANGVLMQFTGLLDKNGKEIYEGDIVEIKNPPSQMQKIKLNGVVIYAFAAFGIEIQQGGQWDGYAVDCPRVMWWLNISEQKHFEVIGNIWENKELLNNNK